MAEDRRVARVLQEEFDDHRTEHLRFYVKALPGRRLELLVWPESGADDFQAAVGTPDAIERAYESFRNIVKLYENGERPWSSNAFDEWA